MFPIALITIKKYWKISLAIVVAIIPIVYYICFKKNQPGIKVNVSTKLKDGLNVVKEQKEVKKPIKRVVKTKNTIKGSKFTKQDLKDLLLKLRSQD